MRLVGSEEEGRGSEDRDLEKRDCVRNWGFIPNAAGRKLEELFAREGFLCCLPLQVRKGDKHTLKPTLFPMTVVWDTEQKAYCSPWSQRLRVCHAVVPRNYHQVTTLGRASNLQILDSWRAC